MPQGCHSCTTIRQKKKKEKKEKKKGSTHRKTNTRTKQRAAVPSKLFLLSWKDATTMDFLYPFQTTEHRRVSFAGMMASAASNNQASASSAAVAAPVVVHVPPRELSKQDTASSDDGFSTDPVYGGKNIH